MVNEIERLHPHRANRLFHHPGKPVGVSVAERNSTMSFKLARHFAEQAAAPAAPAAIAPLADPATKLARPWPVRRRSCVQRNSRVYPRPDPRRVATAERIRGRAAQDSARYIRTDERRGNQCGREKFGSAIEIRVGPVCRTGPFRRSLTLMQGPARQAGPTSGTHSVP